MVTVASAGRAAPFDVRDPYLALLFCVVTEGMFPARP